MWNMPRAWQSEGMCWSASPAGWSWPAAGSVCRDVVSASAVAATAVRARSARWSWGRDSIIRWATSARGRRLPWAWTAICIQRVRRVAGSAGWVPVMISGIEPGMEPGMRPWADMSMRAAVAAASRSSSALVMVLRRSASAGWGRRASSNVVPTWRAAVVRWSAWVVMDVICSFRCWS